MPQHGVACRSTVCLVLVLVFGLLPAVTRATPRGRALLIGNAAYQEGRLLNPVNDARVMAEMLRKFDFEVTLVEDANLEKMEAAVGNFSSKPGQSGNVGLFYFSGHGLQIDNQNYLVPVGARLESPADVRHRTLKADWVLEKLTEAGYRLNIIILDACRNNPYVLGSKSTTRGLARMQEPADSLVAYATAPGMLADDNPAGRNGIYTKHLLQHMPTPGLSLLDMFTRVGAAVKAETNNKQVPWIASSLTELFFFVRPAEAIGIYSPPSAPVIVGQDGAEMVLVPAGEFLMGSDAAEIDSLLRGRRGVDRTLFEAETPKHRVVLDAFYIDKYEVTNTLFQKFVQATGYRTQAEREGGGWVSTRKEWEQEVKEATWRTPHGKGSSLNGLEQHPVVQVSWHDAQAYCTWAGKRLPTEAEWEKAARGTDGRVYPWGHVFDGKRLNFCDRNCKFAWKDKTADDGQRFTVRVGSYEGGKSPYGAYDMAGNVWEWVADWYDASYYQRSPTANPRGGPESGERAVLRGGGWRGFALRVRAPYRDQARARASARRPRDPLREVSITLVPWLLGPLAPGRAAAARQEKFLDMASLWSTPLLSLPKPMT